MTVLAHGGQQADEEPRRYLLACSVGRYPKCPDWDWPGVVEAREKIVELFTQQLGYRHYAALGTDPTSQQLQEHLRAFCTSAERREDDVVVVYFAGRSEVDEAGEHVLLLSDTDPADVPFTAVPVTQLVRVFSGTRVRRLLLILDTCYSGRSRAGYASATLERLSATWALSAAGSGLAIVSSAQPHPQAEAGLFPALLSQVVGQAVIDQAAQHLSVSDVVQQMNRHAEGTAHQRISLSELGPVGALPSFLTNPRFPLHDESDRLGQPIGQWDPHDLEVHPAGFVARVDDGINDRKLSRYVARDHDHFLADAVRSAGRGNSRMAVLVGSSSTGKTRACWEAVQPLADKGWHLWHPFDPSRATAALEELHRVGPRTVVWLNESQHYLGDPRVGEEIAAALHALLVDPDRGPILVLGTLWPEFARQYTALPEPGQADPHSRTRELLSGRTLTVPDTFSAEGLAAATALAEAGDELLSAALSRSATSGRLAQDLAGAPALLRRYEHGTPAAKAVLEAAMDSLRLGHRPTLVYGLLAEGAEGHLTDEEWDNLPDDWLESAMAYLAAPVIGGRGAIVRRRLRARGLPGSDITNSPAYRLADYLEQHGRRTRQNEPVPPALWQALLVHGDKSGFLPLGESAQNRGLFRIAAQFYAQADGGAEKLADLLTSCGRDEEALPWWIRHVTEEAGGSALHRVVQTESDETPERAEELLNWWWKEVPKEGSQGPSVATLIRRLGPDTDSTALSWWRRAAELGHTDAEQTFVAHLQKTRGSAAVLAWHQELGARRWWHRHKAADLLVQEGRAEEAVVLLASSDEGNLHTYLKIGQLLLASGEEDTAAEWLVKAACDPSGLTGEDAARLLFDMGRSDTALEALDHAAARNDRALIVAAQLLEACGQHDVAVGWWLRATLVKEPDSWLLLRYARSLARNKREPEAIQWYQRAVEAGENHTFQAVDEWEDQLLGSQGKSEADLTRWRLTYAATTEFLGKPLRRWQAPLEEKIAWLVELADRGHPSALLYAISRLCDAGREEEALEWAVQLAERGDDRAPREVAGLYARAGELDEALRWWERSAQQTSFGRAGYSAGGYALRDAGRIPEAAAWFRRATEAGDVDLSWATVELYERQGQRQEALAWLRQLADRGQWFALQLTADTLEVGGELHEARSLRRYGWEPDGSIATAWIAPSPS
ncbi:caspase family protein [Streptomyces sp. NPDC055085]